MNYIFLQARMSSSRLPGKVLKPIMGKPMLYHQISRILPLIIEGDYKLIVLTSHEEPDNAIETYCNDWGIDCFRGSLNDVLKRFVDCAEYYGATDDDLIIRITGDCPLLDDEVITKTVTSHLFYNRNSLLTQHDIDGLDVEVVEYGRLKHLDEILAKDSPDREHVLSYIKRRNLVMFTKYMELNKDHLSVDTINDYNRMIMIFEHFKRNDFTIEELIKYFNEARQIFETTGEII